MVIGVVHAAAPLLLTWCQGTILIVPPLPSERPGHLSGLAPPFSLASGLLLHWKIFTSLRGPQPIVPVIVGVTIFKQGDGTLILFPFFPCVLPTVLFQTVVFLVFCPVGERDPIWWDYLLRHVPPGMPHYLELLNGDLFCFSGGDSIRSFTLFCWRLLFCIWRRSFQTFVPEQTRLFSSQVELMVIPFFFSIGSFPSLASPVAPIIERTDRHL